MQTERIVLRPRSSGEAIELGLHLTRANWPTQVGLASLLLIPVGLFGLALSQWFAPLFLLTVIWFKPTVDRALLQQLSNHLLDRPAGVASVMGEWKHWWRGGHLVSLLWHRFNPGRSAALPIWQLERLQGRTRSRRAQALAHNDRGAAIGLSLVCSLIELSFLASIVSVVISLAPEHWTNNLYFFDWLLVSTNIELVWLLLAFAYLPVVALVEPFYVGAGFGLYLNQRSRLEGWDLEPPLAAIVERHQRLDLS